MGDVPIQIKVGNVTSNVVGAIAKSSDVRKTLAAFLRAYADELDGGEPDGQSQDQVEPQGSPEAAAG